ncbi:2'-5' RNA ligase family protein [Marinobacterium sediminicola]|uniref:2'-5' RNA ligase superfamily protein n=1 Tax=Marinobacterium sediminicola TaxID=518898 RepID=A0ABY1S266_9GAMM|nr:2'-5' RNA ligase family protein [Marinobacterium sediminicola]ULG69477.1 2'-5' RNA ligase family protein [Marinobacterium sediminicola]SMR75627.1 2'-5' RNA ligase superfamily protein [Marinobacterium sediminicola]
MTSGDTHTLATELRDFPEWHRGIRHYAVWTLPVEEPAWIARIEYLQQQLAPLLHPGYDRQPHITLFAAGLVDNRHFADHHARQQANALQQLGLPVMTLVADELSTFSTAPWLGISAGDSQLLRIRQTLASVSAEDSPARDYRPHITLGFYQQAMRLDAVHRRLASLSESLPPLPPLQVKRLELCHYATHEIQGKLTVKDSIELTERPAMSQQPAAADPLEAIRQMRQEQLRVCALKQQTELGRLIHEAKDTREKDV